MNQLQLWAAVKDHYTNAEQHTYIHAHMRTYIHAYIHTHTHTYMQVESAAAMWAAVKDHYRNADQLHAHGGVDVLVGIINDQYNGIYMCVFMYVRVCIF